MEKITINGVEYMLTPVENKTVNKAEPKFKVGDWIVQENIGVYKVIEVCESWYEVVDNKDKHYSIGFNKEYMCHLWTIDDAKDGDVLAIDPWSDYPSSFVAIYKKQNGEDFDSYCFVGFDGKFYKGENGHSTEEIHPATEEQRDILFQKMKEAGYEWDAEKKELKKCTPIFTVGDTIIKKPVSDINFGYFTITDITGGKYWYNDRIICEISEQNDWELVKQKPAEWSEEDENIITDAEVWLDTLCDYLENSSSAYIPNVRAVISKLNSLKDRVQPQPKQEWSEEDELKRSTLIHVVKKQKGSAIFEGLLPEELINWLKSIKQRIGG